VSQTFDIKFCSKEFLQLIKKAGFKKKYLKKPESAAQIYQYLLDNPDFENSMLTKEPEHEEIIENKAPVVDLNQSQNSGGGSIMSKRLAGALR